MLFDLRKNFCHRNSSQHESNQKIIFILKTEKKIGNIADFTPFRNFFSETCILSDMNFIQKRR